MIEIATGSTSLVYDGSYNPNILGFLVPNLVTGAYYSFFLKSVNFNGVSIESQSAVFSVCLAPQQIERPDYVSSTPNSITLSWKPPSFIGGCPILTYVMYMNDGTSSDFTEVDSSFLSNKPYITNHTFGGLT